MNNLRSCTGAEVVLYATRGATDLPMQGIAFSTEGVAQFLEHVLKIDTQDFLCKMEVFAVQGIRGELINSTVQILILKSHVGAAENHQQHISTVRSAIWTEITEKLCM